MVGEAEEEEGWRVAHKQELAEGCQRLWDGCESRVATTPTTTTTAPGARPSGATPNTRKHTQGI